MSFDGGNTFQDILAVGGSFVMGGYNRTISTDRGSPIAGRQAWSGNSGGFIMTMVNLPILARQAVDSAGEWPATTAGSGEGWRVDTVTITWCEPASVSATDSSSPRLRRHHAPAVRPAKPSRYARVYSGTSPSKPDERQSRRDRCVQ